MAWWKPHRMEETEVTAWSVEEECEQSREGRRSGGDILPSPPFLSWIDSMDRPVPYEKRKKGITLDLGWKTLQYLQAPPIFLLPFFWKTSKIFPLLPAIAIQVFETKQVYVWIYVDDLGFLSRPVSSCNPIRCRKRGIWRDSLLMLLSK